jgi:choline dehydrogenase
MPVVFGLHDRDRFPTQSTARDIVRWQTVGSGPLASNLAECGGLFVNDRLQIHVTPTHYLTHPHHRAAAAMTIGVNATNPRSRGRLTLRSSRPSDPPIIEPMYLTDPHDLQTTIEGVAFARTIAMADPLASWIRHELVPGRKRWEDESIAKSIARYAQTLYHPVGTCAMGNDEVSVVDERLSVRGIENVSIVDASVMPTSSTGNPNAAVMTIANYYANHLFA